MLYIKTERDIAGKLVSAAVTDRESSTTAESRWNWKTYGDAIAIACALGAEFVATDAGKNVSPRYDVIKLPKVGDEVSGEFNGDSYPEGKIKSISKSLRLITTDTGKKFYRVRETGSWRANQTWFLRPGHVSKQNPSF